MKHLHPDPVPSDDPQGVSEADVLDRLRGLPAHPDVYLPAIAPYGGLSRSGYPKHGVTWDLTQEFPQRFVPSIITDSTDEAKAFQAFRDAVLGHPEPRIVAIEIPGKLEEYPD